MIFLLIFSFLFTSLQDWKKDLNAGEEEKVLNALNYFKFNPSKDVLEDILKLTKNENLKIRYNAILALGFFGDKSVIEKLEVFAKSSEPAEKISFLITLLNLKGEGYFELVKDLIEDPDPRVRIYAKAFYNFSGKGNFKEEINTFLFSKNIGESFASAFSLSLLGEKEHLISLLQNQMDEYRDVGAQALFYAPYYKEILKICFETIEKETYSYVLQNLILSAVFQGKRDISYFTELLIGSRKRVEITKVFLKFDGESLLEELSKVLGNEKERFKEITEILAVFDGEKSLKLLRKIAFDKKIGGDKRYLAIREIGKKNDKDSISNLRNLLKEKDEYLRASSIYALGLLKDLDSKNQIVNLLEDESPRVRQATLFYIRELNLKDMIEKVEGLLNDKDISVRQMAKQTLEKLKSN